MIFNKHGEEVFKTASVDRNRVFANLAVQEGRAVVVNHREHKYVVNKGGDIISVATGKKMAWGEENGDRKAILELANTKFNEKGADKEVVNDFDNSYTSQAFKTNKLSTYTNYSGAAKGSDTEWANIGKEYGLGKQVDYTVESMDNPRLTQENREEIETAYQAAVKFLERKPLDADSYAGKLVRRDYLQAKAADSIFAISTITNNKVNGGTGYAVTMAINMNKSVHVYDQVKKQWYTWDYTTNTFKEETTPTLTPKFAGIGTREINENGKQAIRDVYQRTINSENQNKERTVSSSSTRIKGENISSRSSEQSKPIVPTRPDSGNIFSPVASSETTNYNRTFDAITKYNRLGMIASRFSQIVESKRRTLLAEAKQMLNTYNSVEDTVAAANTQRRIDILEDEVEGRQLVIEESTVSGIKEELRKEFQSQADISDEEWQEMEEDGEVENWEHQKKAYTDIAEFFDQLFSDAKNIIEQREAISISSRPNKADSNKVNSEKAEFNEENDPNEEEGGVKTSGTENFDKIRNKDPWQTSSAITKYILCHIQDVDNNGNPAVDDLDYPKYLQGERAHAVLLTELRDMIGSDDFAIREGTEGNYTYTFPALEKMKAKYPWVQGLINTLNSNHKAIGAVYTDLRKEFVSSKILKDGELIPINDNPVTESFLDTTIATIEAGRTLNNDSLYNKDGSINTHKVETLSDKVDEILQNLYSEDKDVLTNKIHYVLNSLGIEANKGVINRLLSSREGSDAIYKVLNSKVKLDILNNISKEGAQEGTHLVDAYRNSYKELSNVFASLEDNVFSLSYRQGSKTYQSFVAPSYSEILVKNLKRMDPQWLQKEFGKNSWFEYSPGHYRLEWLRRLQEDAVFRDELDTFELKAIDGIEYEDFSPMDIITGYINIYFNGGENFTYYNFPNFADAKAVKFIKAPRYRSDINRHFKEKLLPLFNEVIRQEIDRMQLVAKRAEKIAKGELNPIANFDGNPGKKFNFLPLLNTMELNETIIVNGQELPVEGTLLKALGSNIFQNVSAQDKLEIQDRIIEHYTEKAIDMEYELFQKTILKNNRDAIYAALPYKSPTAGMTVGEAAIFNARLNSDPKFEAAYNRDIEDQKNELLEEFFWNHMFATSQIVELCTTDPAYYKNALDFQKRFKEAYASGGRLMTNSEYGRKVENVLYLQDRIITSTRYEAFKAALEKNSRLQKYDIDNILNKFKDITASDAQAFRSLSSYRAVMDMIGKWNPKANKAMENIMAGKWDMADFYEVWQTIKPFLYGQYSEKDGASEDGKIRRPVQHKNSEFLLLAMHDIIIASDQFKSPTYKALNRFMEEHNIDVVMYNTAVKAGCRATVPLHYSMSKIKELADTFGIRGGSYKEFKEDLDNALDAGYIPQSAYNKVMRDIMPNEEELTKILEDTVLLDEVDENGNRKLNTEVIDQVDYEDYMIAQATPEHLIDHESIFGSQFRNILAANLDENFRMKLGDMTLDAKQTKLLYSIIISENLRRSYEKAAKSLTSIEDLQKKLLSQVIGNPKYSNDIQECLKLVEVTDPTTGKKVKTFNIPIWTPSIMPKMEDLILSTFKNQVTKQYITGGNAILVSDVGLTHSLEVEKHPDGSIKAIQCLMPAYTKKFFDKLGTNFTIEDLVKIDPKLARAIGFRIPTEAKYSMCNLKIVGFLPRQNGSSIMLPADITQIAGSDFDKNNVEVKLC